MVPCNTATYNRQYSHGNTLSLRLLLTAVYITLVVLLFSRSHVFLFVCLCLFFFLIFISRTQVSAIESLLVAEGVTQIMGWVGDEVTDTTSQADIDTKVGQIHKSGWRVEVDVGWSVGRLVGQSRALRPTHPFLAPPPQPEPCPSTRIKQDYRKSDGQTGSLVLKKALSMFS